MNNYTVHGYLTISVTKSIEAKSKAHAREIAESLSAPSLCYQCTSAGSTSGQTWELSGFDDPPSDVVISIEKEADHDTR
jgi:hypothetical protein